MLESKEVKEIYQEIQKKLFYMIPEKWDKIYLYASITEHFNNLETGEMFFYYFPKGVLKKNPVNVYEVPNKFNIEEKEYNKLIDSLYKTIKDLKKKCIEDSQRKWTNLTISIENFKFKIEYNYTNLTNSSYTNYDRHLIWRYKYLQTSLESYNKKERKVILNYINNDDFLDNNEIYIEGIYSKPVRNVIEYNKEEPESYIETGKNEKKEEYKKSEIVKKRREKKNENIEELEKEDQPIIKSQILNFNNKN